MEMERRWRGTKRRCVGRRIRKQCVQVKNDGQRKKKNEDEKNKEKKLTKMRMKKKKVLVVGNGGREHALAWKLKQSQGVEEVVMTPCAEAVARMGHVMCAAEKTTGEYDGSTESLVRVVEELKPELVVFGPETPLVDGAADVIRARGGGVKVVGPSGIAAQLEGSKKFMKDLCARHGVRTAAYASFEDAESAKEFIVSRGTPMVVKADGLAAGKGVVVCTSVEESCAAVDDMLVDAKFGTAGMRVVVEEVLTGQEASFFALVDAAGNVLPLASAQDHKRVGEGDTGPNTGGMGAYSPAPIVTPAMEARVMEEIVRPTVDGMRAEGYPYTGVLFAGLMIDDDGEPSLLEYNVRFGDPECQVLMMRLESDLLPVLEACADGTLDSLEPLRWRNESAMVVVMAAQGYPGAYEKGTVIRGLDGIHERDAVVFHAGTGVRRHGDGNEDIVANGGRVIGVTALGANLAAARDGAYRAVDAVDWPQGFCRRDIGHRALSPSSSSS